MQRKGSNDPIIPYGSFNPIPSHQVDAFILESPRSEQTPEDDLFPL